MGIYASIFCTKSFAIFIKLSVQSLIIYSELCGLVGEIQKFTLFIHLILIVPCLYVGVLLELYKIEFF